MGTPNSIEQTPNRIKKKSQRRNKSLLIEGMQQHPPSEEFRKSQNMSSKVTSTIDQQIPPDDEVNFGDICESNDCFAPAAVSIPVNVGDLGQIYLHVCNKCIYKFLEPEESKKL